MGFVELKESPLAPGASPVRIHFREGGRAKGARDVPVVFLHGGWGYGYYPINRQVAALGQRYRFVIPDRSGYGQSSRVVGALPTGFHRLAAEETRLFLDAMGIERCVLWGHSDGAVIAATMGLAWAERCAAIVLEALHFYKNKPASEEFFGRLAVDAGVLGERSQQKLAADHGEERWREVVQRNADVWTRIGASAKPHEDLYGGQLGRLAVRTLFLHGRQDPRTEPGEIETAAKSVRGSTLHFIEQGRHCPHAESAAAEEFSNALGQFLA